MVIGDGPERDRIAAAAGPNVELLGLVPDAARDRWLATARAFLFAAEEDFGIAPLEAQARGTPVIAYGRGGSLETIRGLEAAEPTGVLFAEQTPEAIAAAVRTFESNAHRFTPAACRANAARFSADRFRSEFAAFVAARLAEFANRGGAIVVRKSLLKANAPLFEWLVRLFDPLLAILAGWLAYRWYLDTWILPERYLLALIGVAIFCFALFPLLRLYSPQRGVTLFEEIGRLVNAWLLLAAAWFGYLFLSKSGADFSRAWSLYWIGFGAAMHFASRAAIRLVLRSLRRRGYNLRHVIIVGAGRLGQDIARRLAQTPWSGLAVRAFYDDDTALAGSRVEGVRSARSGQPGRARPRDRFHRPDLDRAAAARGRAHPGAAAGTSPALGGGPAGAGHLQLRAAQSFDDGGRGTAGDQSHRIAALRRESRGEGRRGFRAVAAAPHRRIAPDAADRRGREALFAWSRLLSARSALRGTAAISG